VKAQLEWSRSSLKQFIQLGLVIVGSVGLLGCPNGTTPESVTSDSSSSGTFSNIYKNTFKKACIECHVPSGAATIDNRVKLDFTTQDLAYSTLISSKVSGMIGSGTCGSANLIVAGDAKQSYLLAVLDAKYNSVNFAGITDCSPYSVHLQDQSLSESELSSIATWITNGAKND
jgi:hypothetical protein